MVEVSPPGKTEVPVLVYVEGAEAPGGTVEPITHTSTGGDPLPEGPSEGGNGPNGPVSPWSREGRA